MDDAARPSAMIYLSQGRWAVVDQDMYRSLNRYKWFYEGGYAKRKVQTSEGKKIGCAMHNLLLTPPQGMFIDHRNRNGLDNRISNLRVCTKAQNGANRSQLTRTKLSKYKGVHLRRRMRSRPWLASLRHHGKMIALGYYANEEDAAVAYNEGASRMFGEFACLNIIPHLGSNTGSDIVSNYVAPTIKPYVQQPTNKHPNDSAMIYLTRGKWAIVDEHWYRRLVRYNWCYTEVPGRNTGYAVRTENRRTIWMHRVIMNPPEGLLVDHKNRCGLDNRRDNLRICNLGQNAANTPLGRGRTPMGKTSQYRGVHRLSGETQQTRPWQASIGRSPTRQFIGNYATQEEAAHAYDKAAKERFGEFASLNFTNAGDENG